MIDYKTCEANEFIYDETFRQWVLEKSPSAAAFWESWLQQNPDREDVISHARELALALHNYYCDDATDERIDQEFNKLMLQVSERPHPTTTPVRTNWWRWYAAASVALLLGFGTWRFFSNPQIAHTDTYAKMTIQEQMPLLEKINNGNKTVNILLNDGSVVSLGKNSRISYPKQFDKNSRTVYLSGEAFFDVAKNPAKPFLIYANSTITKVLGTSFLVRAYREEPDVKVMVKTGRVSVYTLKSYEEAQKTGIRNVRGVVLTPNQQMTYNLSDDYLTKELVEKPAALMAEPLNHEQVFENTSVTRVLAHIEHTYMVKLLYDEEALSACLVNLTFSDENLLERLDVICQTIDATYEVVDGQVVITSKGCK